MSGEVKLGEADYTQNYFFGDYEKNPEFILINMFSPTFVPNLGTLA